MLSWRASCPGRAPGCSDRAARSSNWATARVLAGSATRAPRRSARRSRAIPSASPSGGGAVAAACLGGRYRASRAARPWRARLPRPPRLPWPPRQPHQTPTSAAAASAVMDSARPASGCRRNVPACRPSDHDGHAEGGADASGHVHHPACRRRLPRGDGPHDLGVVGRSVYAEADAEQAEQRDRYRIGSGRRQRGGAAGRERAAEDASATVRPAGRDQPVAATAARPNPAGSAVSSRPADAALPPRAAITCGNSTSGPNRTR